MDMSEYKIIECSVHEQSCFQLVVQYLAGGLSVVVAGRVSDSDFLLCS